MNVSKRMETKETMEAFHKHTEKTDYVELKGKFSDGVDFGYNDDKIVSMM